MKDQRVISTYAKYMICPPSLTLRNDEAETEKIGQNDFLNYPYLHKSKKYHGKNVTSERTLFSLLQNAVLSKTQNKKLLILLSDGKDSLTLALALSKAGVSCETLTLLRRNDENLKLYITNICQRLNHKPTFITVDQVFESFDPEIFRKSFFAMPHPVLDQGYIFFLMGLNLFFKNHGIEPDQYCILDGLGNDEYFGFLPSKNQFRSYLISKLGIWKITDSIWPNSRWYVRSPFSAQGDLSALGAVFPIKSTLNLAKYFNAIPHARTPLELIDYRAFCRGSFHDHQCTMWKTRAAAKSVGTDILFPWLDSALSEYVFNLPLDQKFDFTNLRNKLFLRTLLQKRLEWKQEKRGVDLFFDVTEETLRATVLKDVPKNLIQSIRHSFLPTHVKKRSLLELSNLYGYCLSQGLNENEISEILT